VSVLNKDYVITVDGSTDSHNIPLSIDYMFYVVGDLGGGILSLEASPNNGVNWFTVESVGVPARLIRYLVSGEKVRLTLEGATNPNITTGIRQ
jgi:hypothetical protein